MAIAAYCNTTQAQNDTGCQSFSSGMSDCPFSPSAGAASPCLNAECMANETSAACRTTITAYCNTTQAQNDAGCRYFASGMSDCPFSPSAGAASPCLNAECMGNETSAACEMAIAAYCNTTQALDDAGCKSSASGFTPTPMPTTMAPTKADVTKVYTQLALDIDRTDGWNGTHQMQTIVATLANLHVSNVRIKKYQVSDAEIRISICFIVNQDTSVSNVTEHFETQISNTTSVRKAFMEGNATLPSGTQASFSQLPISYAGTSAWPSTKFMIVY